MNNLFKNIRPNSANVGQIHANVGQNYANIRPNLVIETIFTPTFAQNTTTFAQKVPTFAQIQPTTALFTPTMANFIQINRLNYDFRMIFLIAMIKKIKKVIVQTIIIIK